MDTFSVCDKQFVRDVPRRHMNSTCLSNRKPLLLYVENQLAGYRWMNSTCVFKSITKTPLCINYTGIDLKVSVICFHSDLVFKPKSSDFHTRQQRLISHH